MELIDKARIIADFAEAHGGQPDWFDFMRYNDLGIPYAVGLTNGHILDMSEAGERFVADTWDDLCNTLDIDANAEYAFLDDLFSAEA